MEINLTNLIQLTNTYMNPKTPSISWIPCELAFFFFAKFEVMFSRLLFKNIFHGVTALVNLI